MSEQKPKTITLRRLEPVELPDSWIELNEVTNIRNGPVRNHPHGARYVEVNPIPEGYEACDLADATKVLIGETWCKTMDVSNGRAVQIGNSKIVLIAHLEALRVLAIRPIPEPEPMKGEAQCHRFSLNNDPMYGWARLPKELIGKRVRWEVIE